MNWGHLHGFALDCLSFALDNLPFDTVTFVDSDQLSTRSGYSQFLARHLESHANIGLLSSRSQVLRHTTDIAPAQVAFQEIELWRPFLKRFTQGEQKFVHWSFWPSTIITKPAAHDLVHLFSNDRQLQQIMEVTKIWATEEVLLPTLIALLGYEIVSNPCSYDFVQYRTPYSLSQIEVALSRPDVYWIHPIPRHYHDPLRQRLREALHCYQTTKRDTPPLESATGAEVVLSLPILQAMRTIQGWLTDQEANLLLAATVRALTSVSNDAAVVEVGSYRGRSTVVLGKAVKALDAKSIVYAIDPHDGVLGAVDQGFQYFSPSLVSFQHNMAAHGLSATVEAIAKRSFEVTWNRPIGFLLIDHLHDYANVARDFHHFEPWLVPGAYIAFHDFADYFPGVKQFVNELLGMPQYQQVQCSATLMVLRLDPEYKPSTAMMGAGKAPDMLPRGAQLTATVISEPLVSCIMPTADRRPFVTQAVRHFLRQDYPNRELIILDDGLDKIADLIPADDRIRYVRMERRHSMGAKHNIGCELASGEIIVHWDDDDWMAGSRLTYQAKELLSAPTNTLFGLSQLLFYDPRTDRAWSYRYSQTGSPWVAGATFCYFKRFWEEHRFPDMNEGADTVFVWNLRNVNVIAHADYRFYVATVHSQNTSPKHTESYGWKPISPETIRTLLDEEGLAFYQSLAPLTVQSGIGQRAELRAL